MLKSGKEAALLREIKTERYRGFVPLRVALFVVAGAALVTLVFWQMRIADKRAELAELQTQIQAQNTRNEEIQKTVISGKRQGAEGIRGAEGQGRAGLRQAQ